MENLKLGFLGFGHMGSVLAEGITKTDSEQEDKTIKIKKENIFYYSKTIKSNEFTRLETNVEVVKKSDIIICAVKPDIALTVLPSVKDYLQKKILISICAGIKISKLEELTDSSIKIVQLMPNISSLVGEGVTAFCVNSVVTEEDKKIVIDIFSKCGLVEEVNAKYMDIITALAGSGPAYVFFFIESLIDAGVKIGLPRDLAKKYVLKIVQGSAKMATEMNVPIQQLKDSVCSPGGTTIQGLSALEKNRFKYSVMEAVESAYEKCKTLGNNK